MKKQQTVTQNTNVEHKEEKKMENVFNNNEKKEMAENTMKEATNDYQGNYTSDSFFKEEDLDGSTTPIVGLEIELEEEKVIPEGRYKFIVKDLAMEKQVATRYGIKDRLSVVFNIYVKYDEHLNFDLKQKYNISSKRESNFYKMYNELIGKPPFGKIDLRNLLGIKGVCRIKHVLMDDGSIFPKVVGLNPEIVETQALVTN
jgi:hypothetical protein